MSSWAPPPVFDGLRLVRLLGRGGMGAVYLAHDIALDRPTALKVIGADDPSPGLRAAFLVEARALARLHHPNVVGVYRFGEVQDRPYLAYEFVEGGPLDARVPLPWPEALGLAAGLARGLAAAHAAGVIHRDVKPANALVTRDGVVKLLDFGLAQLGMPGGGGSSPSRPGLSGNAAGTPAYMAPERWMGVAPSASADVWAFGMVLRVLLTGRHPLGGRPVADFARATNAADLPPTADDGPGVPAVVAAFVDRCLARNPDDRPRDGAELVDCLDAVRALVSPFGVPTAGALADADRVIASLDRVNARSGAVGEAFYRRLFAEAPHLRPLFPADLREQQHKLAGALQLAVQNLRAPDALVPVLRDLGRRHAAYGVLPEHFEPVGRALLGAVAELDAAAWSPELAGAWSQAWLRLARIVLVGLAEARGGDALAAVTIGLATIQRAMDDAGTALPAAASVAPTLGGAATLPSAPGGRTLVARPSPASGASGSPASGSPASGASGSPASGASGSPASGGSGPSGSPIPGLPAPLTRFFGRDRELDELTASVGEGARLVTVLGLGGAGKTRLALQLGRRLHREGAFDRVVWVPLADARGRDGAVQALLRALAQKEVVGDPLDVVAGALGDGRVLLLLDNLEHLVEAFAADVARLLEQAPGTVCVVTTQRALELEGERLFRLEPLQVPGEGASLAEIQASPAVRLLADRARARRPGFRLDASTAPTLARLVRRLDGLPLALELAGARSGATDLAALDARLAADPAALADHSRNRPERHRSLDAALRWTVDLLPPALRRLLGLLSVFTGEFDAEDATAVTAERDVEDALAALAAASLLVPIDDAPGRYRMLSTVRVFASALLAPEGLAPLTERFYDWYVRLAERWADALGTPDAARLTPRLDRGWPNVLAVVDGAGGERAARILGRTPIYVLWTARFPEVIPRLDRFRDDAALAGLPPDVRGTLVRAGHRLSLVAGDVARATEWRERVRRCLGEEVSQTTRDGLESELAVASIDRGAFAEAEEIWTRLLAHDEAADKGRAVAVHLDALARVAYFRGDRARARQHALACAERVSRIGDPQLREVNLLIRASIDVDDGRLDDALAALGALRADRRANGRPEDDGSTLGIETLLLIARGWVDEAAALAERVERDDRGHRRLHAYALARLARAALAAGDLRRALTAADRASAAFRTILRPAELPGPLVVGALAAHRLGEPAALERLRAAAEACLAIEGWRHAPDLLSALGTLLPDRPWPAPDSAPDEAWRGPVAAWLASDG